MKLWQDLPNRLVQGLPIWRIFFIVFFAFDMAIGNMVTTSTLANNFGQSMMFLIIFIASVFLLGPDFTRRLASGKHQLRVRPDVLKEPHSLLITAYRGIAPFTRYVALFIIFLALAGGFSELVENLLPSFSSDQDIGIPSGNVWIALGAALLGCLEEFWRWSMIVAGLLLAKVLSKRRFANSSLYRNISFWCAIFGSSLMFGLAHYQEFTVYKSWSYIILGSMGLVLALAAIVTRRFLLAVMVHYVYDFLAISELFSDVHIILYLVAILLFVVVLPIFAWLFIKTRPHRDDEVHPIGAIE